MRRVKKLYSIKESTALFIKTYSKFICMNESYALDIIVENFARIIKAKNKNNYKEDDGNKTVDDWFKDYWETYKQEQKNKIK